MQMNLNFWRNYFEEVFVIDEPVEGEKTIVGNAGQKQSGQKRNNSSTQTIYH